MSHKKVIKLFEKIFYEHFEGLMTMACDVKNYIIMCEPHFVKLFFVNILHSTAVFDFLTSEILPLVIMRAAGLVGVGVKGVVGGQWVDVICTNCTYLFNT